MNPTLAQVVAATLGGAVVGAAIVVALLAAIRAIDADPVALALVVVAYLAAGAMCAAVWMVDR